MNIVTNVVEHKTVLRKYSRDIADSMFSFDKIDDFTIKVFGYWMKYDMTDDRNHIVLFDSVYNNGHEKSFLKYDYSNNDSLHLELHIMSNQDPYTNQYYQDHWVFHTVD